MAFGTAMQTSNSCISFDGMQGDIVDRSSVHHKATDLLTNISTYSHVGADGLSEEKLQTDRAPVVRQH